ncbi:uncharacterized protein LOC119290995 [Triticum dicoccoides]|uniref:uncharacterized protein LOC119290995 n=1 Tax=Triticum dicoccoides TaxID=85692 RepID=UPI000E7A485F|nr:uncharacterized protein LOC119290995 [Triticum dicoccoides]
MPKTSSSPSPTVAPMNPLLPSSSSYLKSHHPPDPDPGSPNPSPCSYLLHVDADDEALIQIPGGPNPSPGDPVASSLALPPVDPTPHISSQFYTFTAASHALMLRCILAGRPAVAEEVRAATSPSVLASWRAVWKDRNEDTAYLTAWKRIQDKLAASADGRHLHFKSNPAQRVSHVGQWLDIVSEAHADPDLLRHLGLKDTVERIRQAWTVGAKFYGIPESFVRVCVAACPVCKAAPAGQPDSAISSPGRGKRRRRFEYTETLDVPARDVPRRLQQLAAKHKVVLCIRQKYIRYKPFMAEVKDYACHRAGVPTSSSGNTVSSSASASEAKKPRGLKREPYQSKRCGCGFRIRAIVPIANYNEKDKSFVYQEEGTAVFKLYAVHSGHEPGPLDGSARIVHRLVGHQGTFEFDPDIYDINEEGEPSFTIKGDVDVDIDDSHQAVLQQVRELRAEVVSLEGKVAKMHPELLGSLSNELSEVLHRIRKFNLDGNTYQPEETLMMGNEVGGWATGDVSHHLDHHDGAFCKEDDMLDDDDTDFGSSLGPIVSWDRMAAECEDRKMLMGDSPKCDKWMLKENVGDFDEKSILNCGDEDGGEDSKIIKPLMHDDTMVTDSSLLGIQIDGFYSGPKWYDSPVGLDSSGDAGDVSFRHGLV